MRPIVLVLLLALFVGCTAGSALPLAPQAADAAEESAPSTAPMPLALSGCRYLEISARVQAADVAPLVPPDFTLAQTAPGVATLLVGGANCASAVSLDRSGPASFGWASVLIRKPADAALASGPLTSVYLYRIEHFVVPGDVYDQVARDVGAERTQASIDAAIGDATSTLTMGGVVLRVQPTPPLPGVGALRSTTWREFGSVPGGYAILEAKLRTSNDGDSVTGILQSAPGSVEARAAGPLAAGASNYGRAYRIDDGFMQFVPRP